MKRDECVATLHNALDRLQEVEAELRVRLEREQQIRKAVAHLQACERAFDTSPEVGLALVIDRRNAARTAVIDAAIALVADTKDAAREHFGLERDGSMPACRLTADDVKALRALEQANAELRADNERLENFERLYHEADADRIRRIGNCEWWQALDFIEGEKLVLRERIEELESPPRFHDQPECADGPCSCGHCDCEHGGAWDKPGPCNQCACKAFKAAPPLPPPPVSAETSTPDEPTLMERVASNASYIRAAIRSGDLLDAAELAAIANTLDAVAQREPETPAPSATKPQERA